MEKRILCMALLGTVLVRFLPAIGEEDLFQGCRSGNLGKVRLAVASGADLRALDADGNTALHLAALSKDVLEYLIGRGAAVDARNRAGYTPFLLAVWGGSWSAAQLLLDKGADLLAESDNGESALLLAALTHEKAMVQFLRSRRYPPDHPSRVDGARALHRAARMGDADAVSLLLDGGEDANSLDRSSRTPLDVALEAGSADCAALLAPRTAERKPQVPKRDRPPGAPEPAWEEKPKSPARPPAPGTQAAAEAMERDPGAWSMHPVDVAAYDIAAQDKDYIHVVGTDRTVQRVDFGVAAPLLPVRVTAVAESYEGLLYYAAEDGGLYRFGMPDFEPAFLASGALEVTAGPGAKVWFTAKDGTLSSWDNGAVTSYPAVKAVRIAAAPDGRVWFTDPEGRIGVFTEPGSVMSLPGYARDIAVGREGTAWKVALDSSIAHWDGNRWMAVSTGLAASRITVLADGTPCVVTAENRIAWIEGVREEPQAVAKPVPVEDMPRDPTAYFVHRLEVIAYDIGAQARGGLAIAGPYHTINGVDGNGIATPLVPVHVSSVALSYDGAWVFVTEEGELRRLGSPDWKSRVLAARAGDVAAGPGTKVWYTAADGTLCSWDQDAVASYPGVRAQRIAVGPDGRVWFTTPEGRIGIFTEPGVVMSLPGYARDIAVGRGGTAWKVAGDGSLARWDGSNWLAASVDLSASRITVLADGTPYVATTDDRIAWIDGTPETKAAEASVSSGTGVFHADGEVRRIRTAAAGKSMKIVILGEGYVREDLETEGEYDKETRRLVDAVVELPPFRYFPDRIEVYVVYVESRQRGADATPDAKDRDTALDAAFYSDGVDQRVLLVHDLEAMERYARKAVPSRDLLLISVNDARFGATANALYATASRNAGAGTMMHEIGHSFGGLGDEYGSIGRDVPPPLASAPLYPNLDLTADPARVKWSSLIGRPKMDKVGVFEGGFQRNEGVFRPQEFCLMRDSNFTDRYCAVCEEAIYRKLCSLLDIPYGREEFLRVYEP